jgi:peptidoglycan/LPS O-acetylase OafA/YrhL
VVAYHFWNDAVRLYPVLDALSPIARAGHFAVPGFFILSGFVLAFNYSARFSAWPPRRVLGFWALRLARIYPVHIVTLLAVAAMVAVADRLGYELTDAGYSTRDFILNVFLVHTWVPEFRLNWNYPSWSISSEWFAYLIFPFAAAVLLPQVATPRRALALVVLCLAGAGVMFTAGDFPFRELLIVVPTFFAGMAIFALTRDRTVAAGRLARHLPELLLAALVAACFIAGAVGTLAIILALFGLVFVLARIADQPHCWWIAKPLVYLGEGSYSLYMTHTLAQKVLYRLLPTSRFESSDWLTRAIITAAYIAAIIAACLASYYLVERPCRRWFRQRLRDRD